MSSSQSRSTASIMCFIRRCAWRNPTRRAGNRESFSSPAARRRGNRLEARGPMTDLAGKVALIPGASGGIGREVARTFVEAGCDVALAYHSNSAPTAEIVAFAERQGRGARADKVDTSDPAQARR